MRTITWTDKNGLKHRSIIRDSDPDDMAPQGLLQDPPVLEEIDWEGVKRDLHNALVERELYSWRDVQEKRGLRGAILSSLKRRLVQLYREAEKDD